MNPLLKPSLKMWPPDAQVSSNNWDQNPDLSNSEAAELTSALLLLAGTNLSSLAASLPEPDQVARQKVQRYLQTIAHLAHLSPSYVNSDVEYMESGAEGGESASGSVSDTEPEVEDAQPTPPLTSVAHEASAENSATSPGDSKWRIFRKSTVSKPPLVKNDK